MSVSKIIVSNRTKEKAEDLKKNFPNISLVDWGDQPRFDMIINATSLGLSKEDKIGLIFKNMNKTSNTQIEVSLSDEKKYAIANVTIYD